MKRLNDWLYRRWTIRRFGRCRGCRNGATYNGVICNGCAFRVAILQEFGT